MVRLTATVTATPPEPGTEPPRRGRIGWIVASSLFLGVVSVLILVLVVVDGAAEHVVTGTTLLGFAFGWALLALLSERLTDQPQRWAMAPATVLGVSGGALLLLAPGDRAMTALGWVWPPLLGVLAVWMARRARRCLDGWTRAWLIYPVCAATVVIAVAGAVETVRGTAAPEMPAAGRTYDVGGHQLYLECSGTGSPTVVLTSGFQQHSPSWAWIAPPVAQASALLPPLARLGLGRPAFGTGFEGLPPDARDRERALTSSARDLRGQRDEWSRLPDVFAQAQALTDLAGTPLLVITAGRGHDPAWFPAQDRLAALSDHSVHRVLDDATHDSLLRDRDVAASSATGIRDLVQAVRTGTPVQP